MLLRLVSLPHLRHCLVGHSMASLPLLVAAGQHWVWCTASKLKGTVRPLSNSIGLHQARAGQDVQSAP